MSLEGAPRLTKIPVLDVATLKVDGVEVTATAAQLNAVGADATVLGNVADAFGTVDADALVKVARCTLTSAADSKISLNGGTAAATVGWQNPEAGPIAILRALLRVGTPSTGACTVDIGLTATSAATAADNLLDGLSVATAGLFDSQNDTNNGTNGVASAQQLAAGKWVTVTDASGDPTGLVATLDIVYIPLG